MQNKQKPSLYYSFGEQIQEQDIVLYLRQENERYRFDRPIMKIWSIVTTNAGKLIGVALTHPSTDSPAIYIRAIHSTSDDDSNQTDQVKTFGDLPGGYITTSNLVHTLDTDHSLCLLFRAEQVSEDQEQNRRLIDEKLSEKIQKNNGIALFYQAKNAYDLRQFDTYISSLEKAINLGFSPAMCELAIELQIGRFLEKNEKRSLALYQHASGLGNGIATYKLAGCYAQGTGINADLDKSLQLLELAAKQGSWSAILGLGSYYRFGWLSCFLWAAHHQGYRAVNEAVINLEKAFAHYIHILNSAPKTETDARMNAQYHLAWMYQDGIGVEQDYEQAVHWYQESSDLGHIFATCNLADKYEHGLGLEQDLDMAFALYSQAAGQVVAADLALGRMYLESRGVEKNLELAQKHLEVVLNSRIDQIEDMQQEAWTLLESFAEDTLFKRIQKIIAHPENFSLEDLEEIQFKIEAPKIPNAHEWRFKIFLELAKKGDHSAQSQVGLWYLKGFGTEMDHQQAYDWINKAFEKQKDEFTYYNMGYLYEHGIVVQQDLAQAKKLYQKSLHDITFVAKKINGKPNPEYEQHYHSSNREALEGLERIKLLQKQQEPKWMFWK